MRKNEWGLHSAGYAASQANAPPPLFFGWRGVRPRPPFSSSPRRSEGKRSAVRRSNCRALARRGAHLAIGTLTLRRSTAAFSFRRRAALFVRDLANACASAARPSASSWRGAVVPPGGAPAPPGARLARPCSGRRTGRRPGFPRRRPPGSAPYLQRLPRFVPPLRRLANGAPQRTRYGEYNLIKGILSI